MKKSLIILPLAALLLIGCKGRGGETSSGDDTDSSPTSQVTPTSQVGPTVQPSSPATSETHPDSPWPAVATGDGLTRETPWNVTQAWEYVDQNLTKTYATSAAEQDTVKSAEKYYIRGYVCVLQTVSDGRDPEHPNSVQIHLADDVHHVTEDEVMTKSDFVRQGFCVYFADTDPAMDRATAEDIEGRLVTVYGYLLNWGFEPEVTSGGIIYDVSTEKYTPAA